MQIVRQQGCWCWELSLFKWRAVDVETDEIKNTVLFCCWFAGHKLQFFCLFLIGAQSHQNADARAVSDTRHTSIHERMIQTNKIACALQEMTGGNAGLRHICE